jgi:hypothetical protein
MFIKANRNQSAITAGKTALALGGLLTAGYLSTAVAHADQYIDYSNNGIDPVVSEEGFAPLYTEVSGPQLFDVADYTTGGNTVGTFEANSYDAYFLGLSNSLAVVTADLTGTNDPPVGSVFDAISLPSIDGSTFANVYTDIVGAESNTITDTLETPWGDFNIPTSFDAASFFDAYAGFDAPSAATDASPLFDLLSSF